MLKAIALRTEMPFRCSKLCLKCLSAAPADFPSELNNRTCDIANGFSRFDNQIFILILEGVQRLTGI